MSAEEVNDNICFGFAACRWVCSSLAWDVIRVRVEQSLDAGGQTAGSTPIPDGSAAIGTRSEKAVAQEFGDKLVRQ